MKRLEKLMDHFVYLLMLLKIYLFKLLFVLMLGIIRLGFMISSLKVDLKMTLIFLITHLTPIKTIKMKMN